jgi:hypothetical protein
MGAELRNIPKPPGGPTVVVVDEDLGIVCRFGKILAKAGYQVIPASNSRQAASLIEKLSITPELVIANPGLLKIKGVSCKTPNDESAELKALDNRKRPNTGLFWRRHAGACENATTRRGIWNLKMQAK